MGKFVLFGNSSSRKKPDDMDDMDDLFDEEILQNSGKKQWDMFPDEQEDVPPQDSADDALLEHETPRREPDDDYGTGDYDGTDTGAYDGENYDEGAYDEEYYDEGDYDEGNYDEGAYDDEEAYDEETEGQPYEDADYGVDGTYDEGDYEDDDYDDEYDGDYDETAYGEEADEEAPPRHRKLKIVGTVLVVFFGVIAALYLTFLYASVPFIADLRTSYVQTAMSTMRHQWLATAFVPKRIVLDIMEKQREWELSQHGKESEWAVSATELPKLDNNAATTVAPVSTEAPAENTGRTYGSPEEQAFFELFWELDVDSMYDYIKENPDVLEDGWAGIDINEAGLDEDGTSIKTVRGDQVLAINAKQGIDLIRLKGSTYRGILAFAKYTEQLSLCPASSLGSVGQTVDVIAEDNDGVLAITGSAFIDDNGTGNGGEIAGLAVCNGEEYGVSIGDTYKRLELRKDGKMYIVDSTSSLGAGTENACEFLPGLIIDSKIAVDDDCGWTSFNPRAVLGQSNKLETMMVVIEGRLATSAGCSVVDVAEILKDYDCAQAMNLDGGTSAIMYYDGHIITRCSNQDLPYGRTLPTSWVYKRID